MKRIAIIGIGLLGSAVASRLLEGGFTVVGHDSRPEQLELLAPRGLVAASSVKNAAAGADAIFTILPTPDWVEPTVLGPTSAALFISMLLLAWIHRRDRGPSRRVDPLGLLGV